MKRVLIHIAGWFALFAFWLWVSADHHPTFEINVIVTSLLIVFYAAAVYFNAIILWPRFRRQKGIYGLSLFATMMILTFIVLGLIRAVYTSMIGAEYLGGYWENFAIDLFGMTVHVVGAAVVANVLTRIRKQ